MCIRDSSLTHSDTHHHSLSTLQIPHTIELYLLDIPVQEARQKLREQFYKNAHVRDPRVIDMLVIKVHVPMIYYMHFVFHTHTHTHTQNTTHTHTHTK